MPGRGAKPILGMMALTRKSPVRGVKLFEQPPPFSSWVIWHGQVALLTFLCEGQQVTVLQLPAEPKTVIESEAQQRVAHVG